MTANTLEAAYERIILLEQMVREKDDTIESVRKALRYGADDTLWPPGDTMAEVVENLVNLYDCYVAVKQNNSAVALTRR